MFPAPVSQGGGKYMTEDRLCKDCAYWETIGSDVRLCFSEGDYRHEDDFCDFYHPQSEDDRRVAEDVP
jgi:hypothetical protein